MRFFRRQSVGTTGQGVESGPVEKFLSVLFQQLVKNPKNLANFV
jgi:hypothetical protein